MELPNTAIKENENKAQFEVFDGELLHPSLDIKNGFYASVFVTEPKRRKKKTFLLL